MSSAIIVGTLTILLLLLMALPSTTHVSSSSTTTSASSMTDFNQTEASEEAIDVYQNPIVGVLANELETRINNHHN